MGQLNDFCSDLQHVLRKQHIRKMLSIMSEEDSAGWEKWLQFELIRFYDENGHERYWECPYKRNLQHKPDKLINRIDLVYRKKNTNNMFYNGVEIKVMKYPEYSIKGILKDLSGVSQIRASEWELRAVTGLSLYSTCIMEDKKQNAKYKSFVNGLISARRAKIVECNGWTCLVLGWESRALSTPRTMKQEYRDYLQSIGILADKHQILMQ